MRFSESLYSSVMRLLHLWSTASLLSSTLSKVRFLNGAARLSEAQIHPEFGCDEIIDSTVGSFEDALALEGDLTEVYKII